MEQGIEERGGSGGITEQLAQVVEGSV